MNLWLFENRNACLEVEELAWCLRMVSGGSCENPLILYKNNFIQEPFTINIDHFIISINSILISNKIIQNNSRYDGQSFPTGHFPHWGFFASHRVWPNPTNPTFMSFHVSGENKHCKLYSVSFGFFVFTQPSLFAIRCTWVSTPIPVFCPYATLR